MLDQRRRRWAVVVLTLNEYFVLAGVDKMLVNVTSSSSRHSASHQTPRVKPMLYNCWITVCNDGPTLNPTLAQRKKCTKQVEDRIIVGSPSATMVQH